MQEPWDPASVSALPQGVRALTAMLHRQWLTVRRAGGPPRTERQKRTMRCLRDTVLLLHGLSQKDKLFTVHCVEVLHQYDQVMPGVSMLIRGLPDVADCEGEPAGGLLHVQPTRGASLKFTDRSHFLALSQQSSLHAAFALLLWLFSEHSRLPFACIC